MNTFMFVDLEELWGRCWLPEKSNLISVSFLLLESLLDNAVWPPLPLEDAILHELEEWFHQIWRRPPQPCRLLLPPAILTIQTCPPNKRDISEVWAMRGIELSPVIALFCYNMCFKLSECIAFISYLLQSFSPWIWWLRVMSNGF